MTPMAMHDDGLDAEETSRARLWLVQSTSLGLLAGAICVWPRLMPWMLAAVTLLFVLPSLGAARGLGRRTFNGLAAPATLLLPALGILSGIWSVDRAVTLATAVTAFGLAVCALVLIGLSRSQMGELTPAWRRRFVRAIPIGAGIGLGYLLAEVLTGNALTRRILSTFPALVGLRGKGLKLNDGAVTDIAGFFMNRNVAGLILLAIPALAAAWLWLDGRRRSGVVGAAALALVLVVFGSESETAKLALILSGLTILAARRWPRQTATVLGGVLALGLLATLTLAHLPLRLGLHEAGFLPYSHRDRVLIWDYNAEVAARHPWLGIGVEAGRALQLDVIKARQPATEAPASPVRRPAWHAHNFYIQTRLELGLLGSLAALAFGLAMIGSALDLHRRLVPAGLGMIAATMASAISGWGLWQYWFLAGLGAAVVFLVLLDADLRVRDGVLAETPTA